MLLVTQTDHLGRLYGDREAVRMLAEAGFDGIDYSMFSLSDPSPRLMEDGWEEEIRALRAYADSLGVPFIQGHAPFSFRDNSPEAWETVNYPRILRSIEIAGILGIRELVIHPIQFLPYKQNKETLHQWNMEYYRSLLPHAKQAGVRICLENMWQRNRLRGNIITHSTCSKAEEAAAWIDELNDPSIGYCLDLGHCGLVELDADAEIRKLGHRLTALHVHDNDFVEDQHILPYHGHANWEAILAALKEVGYSGPFTFEADNFLVKTPDPLLPTALKLMVELGRHMIAQIEG